MELALNVFVAVAFSGAVTAGLVWFMVGRRDK